MTTIQTPAEAGFPLELHYNDGTDHPFIITAGDFAVVGFTDRDHAARTLQDAHSLRIQTDDNGTQIIVAGEVISTSDYLPFVAVETAVQKLAVNCGQWGHQRINFDPEQPNNDDNEPLETDDTHISMWQDADGLHLANDDQVLDLNLPDALGTLTLLSSAVNGWLKRPYSNTDPSTILSRGEK